MAATAQDADEDATTNATATLPQPFAVARTARTRGPHVDATGPSPSVGSVKMVPGEDGARLSTARPDEGSRSNLSADARAAPSRRYASCSVCGPIAALRCARQRRTPRTIIFERSRVAGWFLLPVYAVMALARPRRGRAWRGRMALKRRRLASTSSSPGSRRGRRAVFKELFGGHAPRTARDRLVRGPEAPVSASGRHSRSRSRSRAARPYLSPAPPARWSIACGCPTL